MDELREILTSAYNGNWTQATQEFMQIDLTNQEYEEYLEELTREELTALATIGYYARKTGD